MIEEIIPKDILEKEYKDNKLSKKKIAKKYNTSYYFVRKLLNKFNINNNKIFEYKGRDLKNKKIGRWKVLYRSKQDKHTHVFWKCKCDCGTIKDVSANSLNGRRKSQSCGCYKREKNGKGYKDISGSFWNKLKRRSKERGHEFLITIKDVWKIYEKQGRKCVYTKIPIQFDYNYKKAKSITASIDRIDSYKGYTKDNIQIVHKVINLCKSWLPEQEFIALCNLVSKNKKMSKAKCMKSIKNIRYNKNIRTKLDV